MQLTITPMEMHANTDARRALRDEMLGLSELFSAAVAPILGARWPCGDDAADALFDAFYGLAEPLAAMGAMLERKALELS
jgi:hypothetical protein